MTQSRALRALGVIGLVGLVAACGTTPSAPPSRPIPQPPATEEPEPDTRPEPELQIPPAIGLVPPHMADREISRVAILLPFSASNTAARGEALRLLRAAELALFERAGGDLLMIPKDTQGTPAGARSAALAAVNDGAELIIGPLFGASVRAAGEVARQAGIPVIAFTTDTAVAGNGVYLMSFPPEIEVRRVVEYAALQGVERFAYLGPQDAYGMAVHSALQDSASLNGGYVASDSFYTGDVEAMARASARLTGGAFQSLTPEEARTRREDEWVPDPTAPFQAVMLPEGGTKLRALGPLLISQNVDPLVVRFLGTGQWNDPELLREPALHGGWFAAPDQAARARFETAYRDTYGSEPSRVASLAYDAMALAAHLDGGELGFSREAIEEDQGFLGADGLFRFRGDGMIERGLAIYEIRPRGFREIDPAPLTFEPQAF